MALWFVAASIFGRLATAQSASRGPHAVQPERPTVATHAGTVAPGWFEIEAGIEHDRFGGTTSTSIPLVGKLGIAPRLQFAVFGSSVQPSEQTTGLGDFGINLKWRLLEESRILGDFALEPALKFPTGSVSAGTGTGTTTFAVILISSRDIGSVSLDMNVGYARRTGNGTVIPKNGTLWTASFGGPAIGSLGWVAELFGYPATSGPSGEPSIVALLAGPTLLVRKWLFFDAGFISPITGPQPRAVYVGTVINIGRVW